MWPRVSQYAFNKELSIPDIGVECSLASSNAAQGDVPVNTPNYKHTLITMSAASSFT